MSEVTKVCTTCHVCKPLTDYSPRKNRPLGVHYSCKPCLAERAKLQRKVKGSTEDQKQAARDRAARWREAFPQQNREMKKSWRLKNLHVKTAANARRRAARMKASPAWLSEDQRRQMQDTYWLARDLKAITGEDYHVDHIVPLQGKNVSGLHVPWNLQVLPADINLSKRNTFNG
jgi:hypothetical protein